MSRPRSRHSRLAYALAAVTLAISVTGCGKAAEKFTEKATEKAIESQGGKGANVDIGKDGEFKIETEDGALNIGSGDVPDSWPEDVPLPDSLGVQSSFSTGDGTTLMGLTEMDVDEVMDFYTDALGGWTKSGDFSSTSEGSKTAGTQFEKDERALSVSASTTEDGTILSLTYAEQSED